MLQRQTQGIFCFLFVLDLALFVTSWIAAYWIRFYLPLIPVTKGIPNFMDYLTVTPFAVLSSFLGYVLCRVYTVDEERISLVQGRRVVGGTALGFFIFNFLIFYLRQFYYSRMVLLWFVGISLGLALGIRYGLQKILPLYYRHVKNPLRSIILGSSRESRKVAHLLGKHPWLGIQVLGFFSEKRPAGYPSEIPFLGSLSDVETFVRGNASHREPALQIHQAFVCASLGPDTIRNVLAVLHKEGISSFILVDLLVRNYTDATISKLKNYPIVTVTDTPLYGLKRWLKRTIDVVLSLLALLIFSPFLFLIALVIKVSSRGPVFYIQERVGWDGQPFPMLKFRTMRVDAETQTGAIWAREQDPRVSPVGRWLRQLSLDELPQFINVLLGQMSVVGPRPERPVFVKQFKELIPHYMLRHKIKAGITGWAQVHGWRGNTSLRKRLQYDLYYIKHWSIGLDLKIIFLTFYRGFINKNAY